jgi:tryptophan-rich sensory protein
MSIIIPNKVMPDMFTVLFYKTFSNQLAVLDLLLYTFIKLWDEMSCRPLNKIGSLIRIDIVNWSKNEVH